MDWDEKRTIRFDPVHSGPWPGFYMESGVGLDIGIGWVVFEFKDFEAMYNLAKAARENDDR
jgi:hypothetical protein